MSNKLTTGLKTYNMASNKFDTGFAPIIVREFKLEYTTHYGKTVFEGSASQIMAHVNLINENATNAILNQAS